MAACGAAPASPPTHSLLHASTLHPLSDYLEGILELDGRCHIKKARSASEGGNSRIAGREVKERRLCGGASAPAAPPQLPGLPCHLASTYVQRRGVHDLWTALCCTDWRAHPKGGVGWVAGDGVFVRRRGSAWLGAGSTTLPGSSHIKRARSILAPTTLRPRSCPTCAPAAPPLSCWWHTARRVAASTASAQ